MTATPDILELELFRHAVTSIVDELELNLTRTAYSPLIYEYKDYSVGFLDADFRLVAQSRGSLPLFIADMGISVADAVSVIGQDRLDPGDIFLTNYAPALGQHLNNVTVATPVFRGGETILGYLCIKAHWADVGGLTLGSVSWNARDIFQEGVQYRGLRVHRQGEPVPEVLATIQANTRMPKFVMGDLSAQLGACVLGLRRWDERVAERWSDAQTAALTQGQREAAAKAMERRIRERLTAERYHAECLLDDSGLAGTEPLKLQLSFTVKDGEVDVDLSGMPPQVQYPLNAGWPAAMCAVRVGFKNILLPEAPVNEGHFDAIRVDAPPGTVVSATGDAPMSFWNTTMPTLIELVFKAIGEQHPELVPAGHHASMNAIALAGKRADGSRWMFIDTVHGGYGASQEADGGGPHKTFAHGDTKDIPIELMEARFPLICDGYRLIPDSGGNGAHRGGDGTEKRFEVRADGVRAEMFVERTLDPPWGLNGGEQGRPGEIRVMFPGGNDWKAFTKAGQLDVPSGTRIVVRTSGGGGWGQY
ncbi:MAG: hydantoinase B/oxoprolinase family protein [Pseudomonadota bacterium]|nr:hydantoinase B/oxoprolinase family protein [Pseudomonadota bacterium]